MENNELDNYRSGYISLYRSIRKHWIWQDAGYLKAWVCILMECNHTAAKVLIQGELIVCDRGQSLNSLQTWTVLFGKGWSIQRTRTFFKLLQEDRMIVTEGLSKTTRLTVCKYEGYQGDKQTLNKQATGKKHSQHIRSTTNNNPNNFNNETKYPAEKISAHKLCLERYCVFIGKQTGTKPAITGQDGKAMKLILEQLRKGVDATSPCVETEITKKFDDVLTHFDQWDPFHQKQIKLVQIHCNLLNIMATLKKQTPPVSRSKSMSEAEYNTFMYGNPKGILG